MGTTYSFHRSNPTFCALRHREAYLNSSPDRWSSASKEFLIEKSLTSGAEAPLFQLKFPESVRI